VFYPYLLKGRPMGEILLMNQIHMGWITSFVGDPLYSLPLAPQRPQALPALSWDKNVRVFSVNDSEQGNWLSGHGGFGGNARGTTFGPDADGP